MKRVLTFIGVLLFSGLTNTVSATEYTLPAANSRLIGENTTLVVPDDGRSLEAIAAEYKIGLLAMLEANPGTDPYLPAQGSELIIPSQMLLPDTPRQGIVINLAELRLYYFPKGKNNVIVYPIGIGQLGRNTPVMTTSVSQLIKDPTWTPTKNIRKHYAEQGVILPAVVPAGPENPMGAFALRLAAGRGEYLIHGTNADFGIGMRVSSGCIRLRPDDIETLFNAVPRGTRVQIINEAVKYSVEPSGKRYIEVHQPLSKKEDDNPQTLPIVRSADLNKFIDNNKTDKNIVEQAMVRRSGMPVLVSKGIEPETQQDLPEENPEENIVPMEDDVKGAEQAVNNDVSESFKLPPLYQPGPIYREN
ncbi:L,D-transpeptidase family protein [Photorhabdus laumondii subsp. laumondii]|uniref:Photorhabdus luminescens subsp. laumondii TTO1 complete genome segment 9/17 n=2 Tax=Photorhabdus laumondii subsp. laumondii TaxID=141679 RepID=Q7N3U7_PHOLL|nr:MULTISPECIES: L,D-transpeptidase family protein [Photorhabdus]AXG47669.1 L,D-transpeptidase [Photorhabdus laumondii subsp. laumondii]MCC8384158.1 L,D-transpeptidase family protein [Photorhabdus laumondii]MCC8415171.1 L,D-transpeptidase family protein [Photorhabdus laumondii]NDK93126.1 L,D-transpeptidase family protein [Photorhabdus laumondii subsp. laumondii]NDL19451.1 L,D-transpeptidase family protein [Photorhabdus laumondii subsp. laumondii]